MMLRPIAQRQFRCYSRQLQRFSSSQAPGTAAEVRRLGVVGAGQMVCDNELGSHATSFFTYVLQGLGIALVAAQKAGVSVTLVDTSQASIDKGLRFAGMSCRLAQ